MSVDSETSLSSVVKKNQSNLECCICLLSRDMHVEFSCQHHICLSCFKEYAITKLNHRQFVLNSQIGYTLGCPSGCSDTLLTDLHIFRLLNKINYERYKNFAAEEYVIHHQGILCPTPLCGCGLILDQSHMKIVCPLPIGCGKSFCRECKRLWTDETVQQCPCHNAEENSPSFWNRLFGNPTPKVTEKQIKKCPNCSVNTEKDGGCNAISCTCCGMTWCWICEMEFRTDCIETHWF